MSLLLTMEMEMRIACLCQLFNSAAGLVRHTGVRGRSTKAKNTSVIVFFFPAVSLTL